MMALGLSIACRANAASHTAVQAPTGVLTEGERFVLHSKVLSEDRTVLVSLPDSYATTGQSYPVLYLTDAQWQFDQARSSANFLARNGIIPGLIVVGVTNVDRPRDLYATRADFKSGNRVIPYPTSGNADQFLKFIQKELIPWTETHYRTSGLRILAGHSAGGYFALHAMRMRHGLFQAIIAASPWLAWDSEMELHALAKGIASQDLKTYAVFLSSANEGDEMTRNVDTLAKLLSTQRKHALLSKRVSYPHETHDSTVVKSYFDAMEWLFEGWAPARDPNSNDLEGSLSDIKSHYSQFGKRLGYIAQPPEEVVNEFGYQELRLKKVDKAIAAFELNATQYPMSANAWDSLADGFEAESKIQSAFQCCQRAVALAKTSADPRLASFESHAKRLDKQLQPSGH